MGLIQDYTIEVHKRLPPIKGDPNIAYQGTIDKHIQPSLTQELGTADELTFNILMSDPKISLFADDNQNGLEVWLWGRDMQLKGVFVVSAIELSRDYGSTGTGSGSGGLGSGSGDTVLITCTGLENYLARYIVQNYKIHQRLPSGILNDITAEMQADAVLSAVVVHPSLDTVPLDVDLSWENVQTAVNNIIAQTGGYMRVLPFAGGQNPTYVKRGLYLLPLPGGVNQPTDTGMTSPVLPQ